MKTFLAITTTAGVALTIIGAANLKREPAGLVANPNPLAIKESAYGMLLAELSQDTVDRVWHLGIEQVNPIGHHHGDHDHDHDHDHGHDHGDHDDHDHAPLVKEDRHDHDDANADAPVFDEKTTQALLAAGIEPDMLHCSDCTATVLDTLDAETRATVLALIPELGAEKSAGHLAGHDHEGHHDHDEHCHDGCEADHHHEGSGLRLMSFTEGITAAKEFLSDMRAAAYDRTNPYAVSEAHKKYVSADIERMLMRSYKMDPTNYGVYNAYYLFLTVHEFGATPAALVQARKISEFTIARAQAEKTAPSPWLTAEMALLNLFLLDQQDWKKQGIEPPLEKLREYRDFSSYCKQNFEVLKQRAIADGRWQTISQDKRDEMDERQQFANKTFEQFDVMIARRSKKESIIPGIPNLLDLPVATSESEDIETGAESAK